jgi:hypothetical protein
MLIANAAAAAAAMIKAVYCPHHGWIGTYPNRCSHMLISCGWTSPLAPGSWHGLACGKQLMVHIPLHWEASKFEGLRCAGDAGQLLWQQIQATCQTSGIHLSLGLVPW